MLFVQQEGKKPIYSDMYFLFYLTVCFEVLKMVTRGSCTVRKCSAAGPHPSPYSWVFKCCLISKHANIYNVHTSKYKIVVLKVFKNSIFLKKEEDIVLSLCKVIYLFQAHAKLTNVLIFCKVRDRPKPVALGKRHRHVCVATGTS